MGIKRLKALLVKEILELGRDKATYLLVIVLPIILFLIYGFGLNLDLKPATVGVIVDTPAQMQTEFLINAQGSDYLELKIYHDEQSAREDFLDHSLMGILYLNDLRQDPKFYLALNGSNAQKALIVRQYVTSALLGALPPKEGASLSSRMWFNDGGTSLWYLIPAQLIGVISLICTVTAALLIAKEFNEGTIETLLTSKLSAFEIVLGKLIPGFMFSAIAAVILFVMTFYVYEVPLFGSLFLMILTFALYMLVSLLIGLFISALVKDKFLATEYAIILSFMPSILLSGNLFDLRAVPRFVEILGNLLPPTYAIESMRICCLSGGSEIILYRNLAYLSLFALLFLALTVKTVAGYRRS